VIALPTPGRNPRPNPGLTGVEYQRWYDYGVLPERLHDGEIAQLRDRYVAGDLTIEGFEEELATMMGLPA
jgi:hypothetical protein